MSVPLRTGEVHVWRLQFSSAPLSDRAWSMMSDDERVRASSFRFVPDRERFCQSRLLLRQVLGRYLQLDPAEVAIVKSPRGKPLLDTARARATNLQFNLAHCQSVALLGVTSGQSVGIDVEDGYSVRRLDVSALAQEYFTPSETRAIEAIASPARARAFLACWTRKEALLKAVGLGLQARLDSFEVPLDAAPSWKVRWAPDDSSEPLTFDMVDLTEGGVFAAVAAPKITGPVLTLDFQDLDVVNPLMEAA